MSNQNNGDTNRIWTIRVKDKDDYKIEEVYGIGSFHKTLPHNEYGEVDKEAFASLVSATRGDGQGFSSVPRGEGRETKQPDPEDKKKNKFELAAPFTNPQAGLAEDQLTHPPSAYHMPPAPRVLSNTTAAEMVELYWMALLRDHDLCDPKFPQEAIDEINEFFCIALSSVDKSEKDDKSKKDTCNLKTFLGGDGSSDSFILGVDVPGSSKELIKFNQQNLFRLGFPGDERGPMISQFFLRPAPFGTQTIDQRQRPYKAGKNYLTDFGDWLKAQNSGKDENGQAYPKANEFNKDFFEDHDRYIATMRDLARFVNKDALHQAYFNAALILLAGGAKWPIGNPYHDFGNNIVQGALPSREAGFGVLGGPHILALVSEVATRALKIVWQQKWQVHLRLRPEAYGGLVHAEGLGVEGVKRPYGLPKSLFESNVLKKIKADCKSYLLPMAFTPGSPTHPAYGAGHATVAGACVTVLKAFFLTFITDSKGEDKPIPFCTLEEREEPFGKPVPIRACGATLTAQEQEKCFGKTKLDNRVALHTSISQTLTIEGELNKLAQNVAMGRSMGGVHWRTDNTRSLMLGEAIAAEILADITKDVNEKPTFTFRTFSRRADGKPKKVFIEKGKIYVDGVEKNIPVSIL